MRILMVCICPVRPELGAAQVHINLARSLVDLGHSVRLWSPHPLSQSMHWTVELLEMRAKLRALLRSNEEFDIVDCPPQLVPLTRGYRKRLRTRWVARTVQPDLLYFWEELRRYCIENPQDIAGMLSLTTWSAGVGALICTGWMMSDVVMCFGSVERAWMERMFPRLRAKLGSYDGAISDENRIELATVRRQRPLKNPGDAVRYIWIGRWSAHKGISLLMRFLRERVDAGTKDTFTIAGCGPDGERALAPLVGSRQVCVVPAFTRAELPGLLAAHDAGLFTSSVEGWGLVLNEMIEAGIPVYATNAGGVADIRSVLGSFVDVFPPMAGTPLPQPPTEKTIEQYEKRFRWRSIAIGYLESISTLGHPR
jgi:glycosyltransferase involved in cell wall biosynthesis